MNKLLNDFIGFKIASSHKTNSSSDLDEDFDEDIEDDEDIETDDEPDISIDIDMGTTTPEKLEEVLRAITDVIKK